MQPRPSVNLMLLWSLVLLLFLSRRSGLSGPGIPPDGAGPAPRQPEPDVERTAVGHRGEGQAAPQIRSPEPELQQDGAGAGPPEEPSGRLVFLPSKTGHII